MDTNQVKAEELNKAFRKVHLPVGRFKEVDESISAVSTYEVANRTTSPFKAKRLVVMVTNASNNLCTENGRHFSFKIVPVVGNEDK
jgi:ribosomal protein S5